MKVFRLFFIVLIAAALLPSMAIAKSKRNIEDLYQRLEELAKENKSLRKGLKKLKRARRTEVHHLIKSRVLEGMRHFQGRVH